MKNDVRTVHMQADCRICTIMREGATADAFNSVWLSSDEYKALISVGSMVPGWTLIFPAEHEVNLGSRYGDAHLHEFVQKVLAYLRPRYGQCVIFEHGAGREDSITGCGVGHAHLHVVPLNFPLAVEAMRSAPELNWRTCVLNDVQMEAAGSEYLFVADEYAGPSTAGLLATLDTPRSQFFRRVIASRLGLADFFDYKKYPMLDIAESSAETLRAMVSEDAGVRLE